MRLVVAAGVIAACGLSAACGQSVTSPSSTAPYSQIDLLLGTGDVAVSGNILTVNYTGWLYDTSKPDTKGLLFDTSNGKTPFVFTLGTASVIAGWDQGLVGMKVGGIRRLVVPPSLAYGGIRNSSIPAYSTLVFDVELLGTCPAAGCS
ncbi:MAG TPA: FKBP-type peptidyl-prolyl cis-trans isomerase [Vicinamibacterales bacterium]|jgi:FKBP-type peptidyl-prolyl cis-trans isomerase